MRIAVFNDTSGVNHIGCQGVSNAHKKHLKGHDIAYVFPVSKFINFDKLDEDSQLAALANEVELMAAIHDVEAIVINGEGTLHHDRGSSYLAIAKLAKDLDKKVYLVNTIFQAMTKHIDVLPLLDDMTVREIDSFNHAKKLGAKNLRLCLDSIIDADFINIENIDFQNQLVFTDFHHERNADVGAAMVGAYNGLIKSYMVPKPFIYTMARDDAKQTWKHAVQNLRTAKIVVTARHHGVYLAGLAGVPFIACPGNSWKIESLIKQSGLPIPVCQTEEDIYLAYIFAQDHPETFQKFSEFIHKERIEGLKTFDVINGKNTK